MECNYKDEYGHEYYFKIIRFLLYRSENDRVKLLEAARQIIVDGIGSRCLDRITEKSFLDKEDDYYTRICYYVEKEPANAEYLFQAFVEWYESWKDEFCGFPENKERFYTEQRLKTWAYCMLTGQPEVYAELSNEVSVILTESEAKDLRMIHAVRQKVQENRHFIDKSQSEAESVAKMEEETLQAVQKSLQAEEDQKVIDLLKGKYLVFYTNGKWKADSLQAIQYEYSLGYVGQESALDIPRTQRQCDYIIFVTAQARHDVYRTLVRMYGSHKIFLVKSQNARLAMDDFMEQLLGYRRD